ncbi:transporter [Apiospora saccharicola]|uniref:Transporter n=1 Tax=Apiospora saccharicola TaxID=335842 RepID=A0ABR1UPU7_9PEZI
MPITVVDQPPPPPPTERDPLLLGNKKHNVTVTTRSLSDSDSSDSSDDDGASTTTTAPPVYYLHPHITSARFLAIFSQILVVQFVGCFDATVMASSHPAITSHFHAAPAASWLSTSFLLASTVCQPLVGRLSDATGRRPLFLACLGIFAVATAGCAAAPDIGSLIATRGLCGVGAGGLMVLGDIILSDLVPVERRGLYYPYSSIVYGVGCTLGAAMGGFLAEHLGWRWIFASQIPIMLVCLAVSAVAIPRDLGFQQDNGSNSGATTSLCDSLRDFDFVGSGLLCVILTTMILGLVSPPRHPSGETAIWSHPVVTSALVVCVACIPIFLYVEWRCARHPLVPLDFLSRAPKANLLASNFISTMLTNSVLFNMPIFLQAVLLASATRSGLQLMAPFAVTSLVSALTAYAIARTRRLRWSLVSGATFFLVGTLALTRLGRHTPHWVAVLALVPTSVGQGLQNPGTFIAVLAAAAEDTDCADAVGNTGQRNKGKGKNQQALATSVMVLVRSVGQVVGIAASSLLLQGSLRYYLAQLVEGEGGPGDRKDEVIRQVLASIESIPSLEAPYRMQAVESYEKALRTLFAALAGLALVSLLILGPAKMPRIGGGGGGSSRKG